MKTDIAKELISQFSQLKKDQSLEGWIIEHKSQLHKLHFNNLEIKWKNFAEAITKHLDLKEPLHVSFLTKVMSLNVYHSLIRVNRI